jgi:BirA family transcriptional regulator, biotin operon repressor / biotin---[acetyl-CoA-carboxylase] ligase
MPLDAGQLRAERPSAPLYYFSQVGSTMTEASRLARDGAPHGTAVFADEQTAGVGRMGRSWSSEPEVGIYCSIILRLELRQEQLPIVSLLIGVATARSIESSAGVACDLRWPNDVLISERKVAGVLAHLAEGCVIAGIGINVNNTAFDPGLRTPATSLRLSAGREIQRERVALNLLESLDRFCALLSKEGPNAILRSFTAASSYVWNRRVHVEEENITGTTAGLDSSGFLLLRGDNGQIRKVTNGGIRPA